MLNVNVKVLLLQQIWKIVKHISAVEMNNIIAKIIFDHSSTLVLSTIVVLYLHINDGLITEGFGMSLGILNSGQNIWDKL